MSVDPEGYDNPDQVNDTNPDEPVRVLGKPSLTLTINRANGDVEVIEVPE